MTFKTYRPVLTGWSPMEIEALAQSAAQEVKLRLDRQPYRRAQDDVTRVYKAAMRAQHEREAERERAARAS